MTVAILPATAHPVAVALNKIHDEAASIFFERRAAIEAILLAVLAKQHGFILGPPGTGKTALCRDIFGRIEGSRYFETLLSKNRNSEAVTGPVNIPALQRGDYEHKTKGYLPEANFAMLDEVGKMSPTMGHDLLAILLERRFHQVVEITLPDGTVTEQSWMDVPLYSFIGGSNELPTEENDDAAALYDRILVRLEVGYLQESGNFAAMLTSSLDQPGRTTVDFAELRDVIDNVVPNIPIPHDVLEAVLRLRDELRSAEIFPSDRRWKQCMSLLRASAFFQGHDQVEEDDIQVLRYALWDRPDQKAQVERLALGVANPQAAAAAALLDDIEDIAKAIRNVKGQSMEKRAAYGTEATGKLKVIATDIAQATQNAKAAGRSTTRLDEVSDSLKGVQRSIYMDLLDMPEEMLR